jgi:hypothetical protein
MRGSSRCRRHSVRAAVLPTSTYIAMNGGPAGAEHCGIRKICRIDNEKMNETRWPAVAKGNG